MLDTVIRAGNSDGLIGPGQAHIRSRAKSGLIGLGLIYIRLPLCWLSPIRAIGLAGQPNLMC